MYRAKIYEVLIFGKWRIIYFLSSCYWVTFHLLHVCAKGSLILYFIYEITISLKRVVMVTWWILLLVNLSISLTVDVSLVALII